MEWVAIVVVGVGLYVQNYLIEKGKNLATKEDIAGITEEVEAVRTRFAKDAERLKSDLALLQRRNRLLLDEKIRVFKHLKDRLVQFKAYCDHARGSLGFVGELHPNLESHADLLHESALTQLTELNRVRQSEFIFLSHESRRLVDKLIMKIAMVPSMELALTGLRDDSAFVASAIELYGATIDDVDECLEALYRELQEA